MKKYLQLGKSTFTDSTREFTLKYEFPQTYFLSLAVGLVAGAFFADTRFLAEPLPLTVVASLILISLLPTAYLYFNGRLKARTKFLPDGIEVFDGSTTKFYQLNDLKGFQAMGAKGKCTTNFASAQVFLVYVANSNDQIKLSYFTGSKNWPRVGEWLVEKLRHLDSDGNPMELNDVQKSVPLQRRTMNEGIAWLMGSMLCILTGWIFTVLYFRPVRTFETLILVAAINSPFSYLIYRFFDRRIIKTLRSMRIERWRTLFIQSLVLIGIPMASYDLELYLNNSLDSEAPKNYSTLVLSKEIEMAKHGPIYLVYYATPLPGRLNIPGDGTDKIYVRERDYDHANPGTSTVKVAIKPGRLGIPWIAKAYLE